MLRAKKLLKSANVSQSYSKNKSDTFFMDHCVYTAVAIVHTCDM